jgi:ABC-type dipeptide/oligopeptide/nickel transport system ATPase subunit
VLDEALYFDEQVSDEWNISETTPAQQVLSQSVPAAAKQHAPAKRNTKWGLTLSGGEWAKICFARSLMKDADLR